jgi:hypothetical protein
MTFKEFIETVSTYECFSYTHIMEIPKSSLAFAKKLNNEQWNTILQQRGAIALCCKIDNDINILFSSDCYKDNIFPETSIIDNGSIVIDKNKIAEIIISAPRNEKGEIQFSNTPSEFGLIEIISPNIIKDKKEVGPNIRIKEKAKNLEEKFDFVINLREKHCGQVSVDNNLWQVFEHEYIYLIQHNEKYYFSSDLNNLIDAEVVLAIDLNEKNIYSASFISNDLFYYSTRETYTNYSDCRCGLISISRGQILNSNRYYGVVHYVGGNYFIVNSFYENNRLMIKNGLIDINGEELLPPIYYEIRSVIQKDKSIKFWIKKEKIDNDWMIFEQDKKNIRMAKENDYE